MANFITVQDLKDNTAIQSSVPSNLLSPYILPSQDIYARRVLGIAQYDALDSDITQYNLTGLTGTSLTLQQKMSPMLQWYTFYTAFPWVQNKVSPKGIMQLEDEHGKPVSELKYDKLRKEIFGMATFYENELLRFLRTNKTSYPLWREDYYSQYELNSGATYSRTFFGGIEFESGTDWLLPLDER